MDLSRLRSGERMAAIGGIALFIIMLFFTWFEAPGTDQIPDVGFADTLKDQFSKNAFEAFGFIDLVLFLTVIAAVGLAVLTVTQRSVNLPVAASAIVAGLGILSTVLVAYRILDPLEGFDRKIGLFLGLISAAAVAYGGWRSMQEEGTSFGQAADQLGDRFGGGSPPPPPPPSQPPPTSG